MNSFSSLPFLFHYCFHFNTFMCLPTYTFTTSHQTETFRCRAILGQNNSTTDSLLALDPFTPRNSSQHTESRVTSSVDTLTHTVHTFLITVPWMWLYLCHYFSICGWSCSCPGKGTSIHFGLDCWLTQGKRLVNL